MSAMKQSIHILQSLETLRQHLETEEIARAAREARSILVQIYSVATDPNLAQELVLLLESALPGVVVVGSSTVGEVALGVTHTASTLLVFSFFRTTSLRVVARSCPSGTEYACGRDIGTEIRRAQPQASAVLLLATPLSFDVNPMLKGLGETLGDCPVFGGGAGDYAAMVRSWVLHGRQLYDQGAVAVAMAGEHLQVDAQSCLGWCPLGREMTVTGVQGMRITHIDGAPALEVYQRYINVEKMGEFGLISAEFPFLFNTRNGMVARVPIAADADGALVFMANIEVGDKFRIGCGDPQKMLDASADIHKAMGQFAPEGILVFSCGCRRYLMQEDVELETRPLQALAPTAGFYTYGEFFGSGPRLHLMNAALLAVGLREVVPGEYRPQAPRIQEIPRATVAGLHDPYAQQHSRVLSSLLRFISSVTSELEQANADLRKLTDDLHQAQELYHLVADNSADVIWLLDWVELRFRYVSPSVQRQHGWTAAEIMALPWSSILHPQLEERLRKTLNDSIERLQSGDPSARFITMEIPLRHKNGSTVQTETAITILLDAEQQPCQVLGVSRDISARKAAEEAVRRMAFHDHLTALPNRRLLEDRLHLALAKAQRGRLHLALLFIDLDKFKPVNDELGHDVGDWLLRQVAERLKVCLRESDTVARIGGDEFIVLLPEIGAAQAAIDVAEKIRAALEEPFPMDPGQTIRISSSIGVVIYPEHASDARELMRMGDEAMYQAKKGGRNAVELYSPPPRLRTDGARIQRIVWNPAFACGEPTLDDEHQQLFRQANALIDLVSGGHPDLPVFNRVFDAFLSFLNSHFEHEEEILRTRGYADLAAHAQEHRALLEQVGALRESLDASGVPRVHTPVAKIVDFLVNDITVGHMVGSDQGYFAQVAPSGIQSH